MDRDLDTGADRRQESGKEAEGQAGQWPPQVVQQEGLGGL